VSVSILDAAYCRRVAGSATQSWHPAPAVASTASSRGWCRLNSIDDDSGGTAHLPSWLAVCAVYICASITDRREKGLNDD
jgi:hypothetical protein